MTTTGQFPPDVPEAPATAAWQARIVVCDDTRAVREEVLRVLSGLPKVLLSAAANGAEAVQVVRGPGADLLICDLEMPVLDGLAVLRTLRVDHPANELPILMLTSRTEIAEKVRALGAGANDYVTKPVAPEELLARVRVQLRVRELQRQVLADQALQLAARYREAALKDRMAVVRALARDVSHEINNPLTVLKGAVEFLHESLAALRHPSQGDQTLVEVKDALTDGIESIERIAGLTRRLASLTTTGEAPPDLSGRWAR
ncbi:MAG: response regulator [Deltaproteobacteria bacterium]|nr:response regulator [Deltaproteobacteria bacterium]